MAAYEKGSWVWYNHESETWLPAKVTEGGSGTISVELEDTFGENAAAGMEYSAPAGDPVFMPMDESNLEPADDMVTLGDLHEAALLHNVRLRFFNDDIFTYIGPILCAANPYKMIPIFTGEFVSKYFEAPIGTVLPPHVYGLANNALVGMIRDGNNQSVVISGESGAGKTEETKLTLQFLAEVAKGVVPEGTLGPEQLLLQSSPIMEALGNAKTVRNNNSSRFGKYMEILFNKQNKIMGGRTTKYLLEKSRVINPGVGERNYHVFYYLDHLPDAKKKELKYSKAEDYVYCNKGGCTTVEGIDDVGELKDFMNSWETLGVPSKEVDSILRTISGILALGNITFEGDEESSVANDEELEKCGELFSNDAELLETTLTFRNMQSGGRSIVVIPLKVPQAIETQEGLGKAAYSKVFDWVVDRLNVSVAPEVPEKNAIGVLDIFGFEIFETNSFEQLCINLANEKLQSHFNDHIFKMELKVYEQEGLDVSGITFADNQPCLDMIEKKPNGIFPMIDEECVVPKGTDSTLLTKLQDTHKKNVFFGKAPKGTKSIFVVNHYAGGVSYDVLNFLEKNRDMLQPDIQAFMAESKDSFVADLFPAPKQTRGRAPTLGGQFRESLQQLYDKLNSTDPHFIKCLKTNQVKKAGVFEGEYCLRQITYLGLLEVVNIRRQGFPVRRDVANFMSRYKVLDDSCADPKALLTKIGLDKKWQMGKTMVFMKDEQFLALETLRGLRLEKSVLCIQAFLRDEHARRCWKKYSVGFALAQQVVRGFLGRKLRTELKTLLDARKGLEDAISGAEPRWPPAPDRAPIDAAVKAGAGLGAVHGVDGTAELVAKGKALLERIKAEEPVYQQLEKAMETKDEASITDALAAAKGIDFDHDLVKQGEKFLADEKEKRERAKRQQEEEEQRMGAEAAAAAKAERVAATKKAVQDAVDMSEDDLMEKRKALNSAISRADEEGIDDAVVQEAKDLLEKVKAKVAAQTKIDEGVEDADVEALKAAIAKAEEIGLSEDKITAAKQELEKIEAAKEFDEAIDGKDQARMDAAYERCKAAGLDVEKPEKGKKPRKMTAAQKSTRKGQQQLLEDIALMPYGARLAEMESVFILEKFHNLRRLEDDQELEYRKKDIERPLCKYDLGDAEKTNAMETKAKATFSNMLGYMGEKYHQYPELLASQIIQDGIENEPLRDEIYLQVVMQIMKNSTPSLKRCWQMMTLLVKTFPPSKDFHPFLEVFFYHATHGEHNTCCLTKQKEKDAIIQIAQVCLRKLDTIVETGAKETAPSEEEIKALRAEQPIMLSVYFTDHSFKKFQIDEDLLVSDLLQSISATLKVKAIDTYALYDVSTVSDPIVIDPDQKVLELMNEWQKVVKLGKGRFAKKGKARHNMVFSKRLYTDKLGAVPQDPVELHLLYTQAKGCVMRGKYAVTDTESLLLAALTMQIDYGDYNPEKHTAGFLRNELIKYIPKHLYALQKPEVWEKDFVVTHQKMKGFSELMSKQAYVKSCMKFRGYGYTFYVAKQTHLKGEPKTVFVGVNVDGVSIFKTSDKSLHETYRFAKLKSWAATTEACTFKVSPDEGKHQLQKEQVVYTTEMAEDICKLLKDYALWLAAKRKKEKAAKKKAAERAAAEAEGGGD